MTKNKNIRILIILIALIISFIIGARYLYKDHRNIAKENAEFTFKAKDLANEFLATPISSEKKYLNKTIEVSGIVSEIENNHFTLDGKIFCQLKSPMSISVIKESPVNIKGRFIGYDNLLETIKLDQCVLINH